MEERKKIFRVILVATVAFAAAIAVFVGLVSLAARSLPGRIETALENGNTKKAEKLAGRLNDEEIKAEYENRILFMEASILLEDGKNREAAALFAELGGFDRAEENYREAIFRLAAQELDEGDYDAAQRRFEALGTYRDAPAMALRAQIEKASALEAKGQTYDAFLLLYKLKDNAEARERALALAGQICGRRDLEEAFALAQNLSSEEILLREELEAKREKLPRGIVDVGFYHTVALKSDGTVLACGDNAFGQCEVDKWKDVRTVCAGAYHTAALFSDGTVAAVGRNDEGQCETQDWRDIVAITAGDYATFGLKADGRIVCCGYNDYYMLADWPKVTAISGGSYALAALREDGEALISHESARSAELTSLVDIAVNTGYAVGLKADGRVVCASADLSGWRDIIAISASSNMILGLDKENTVRAHFFLDGAGEGFSNPGNVVAMAAGGTHCVFVHSDGSLAAWGENTRGECEVGGWKLF